MCCRGNVLPQHYKLHGVTGRDTDSKPETHMSELDLSEHKDMTVNDFMNRAQLDVVRNGSTKTVAVKDLLHGVHDQPGVALSAAETKAAPVVKAKPEVINPAMSVADFKSTEVERLQKEANFERDQQNYLNGGAPKSTDYW